jgi:lipopolysaccharide export system protein LptA
MQCLTNSLLVLALLHTSASLAESADRNKPIYLEADQVLIDDAHQSSTYTGNVRLSQGTLLVRGDKIVVTQDRQGYSINTAYGHTAEFRQKREGLDEYVEGYGERIVYDTRAENIDMFGQAHIIRGLDDLRGDHITYSAKTDIYQVNSGANVSQGTKRQRVRAVLHPKPQQDAPPSSAPSQPAAKPGTKPSPRSEHE